MSRNRYRNYDDDELSEKEERGLDSLKKKQSKYDQYNSFDGIYFASKKQEAVKQLPPGMYEAKKAMGGVILFNPLSIVTDDIIDLPDNPTNELIKDIEKFWKKETKAKYKKYGNMVYKRGALIEGPPGTGKTISMTLAAQKVVEKGAVVIFNPNVGDLSETLRTIKMIEPDKKVVIMWEEFDSVLGSYESELLSILDGELSVEDVYYCATTNYISRIPSRIKDRPSRFALRITVNAPSKKDREFYLKARLKGDDSKMITEILSKTDGFMIDHLKDLIVSVFCMDVPLTEAIRKIKAMRDSGDGLDDYNEGRAKSVLKSKLETIGDSKSSKDENWN